MSDHQQPWLFEMLREMKELRPPAVLGRSDVYTLQAYLTGFMRARVALGVPTMSEPERRLWQDFGRWCHSLMPDAGSRGWPEIVVEMDASADNVATFFKLLDEFLGARGMKLSDFSGAPPAMSVPGSDDSS